MNSVRDRSPNNEAFFGIGTSPLRRRQGELLIETQAAHGLQKWADHFSSVTWANRLTPERIAELMKSVVWTPVADIKATAPVEVVPLPWAFDLSFLKLRRAICRQLRQRIALNRYVHFALGFWNGCWGRQGASVAIRSGHPFSIHLETVSSNVQWAQATSLKAKVKFLFDYPLVRFSDRHILKRAAVVQCNGMDTYNHYAPYSTQAKLIHDLHTTEEDLIEPTQVLAKQARLRLGEPLRIRYPGRLIPLKGPLEWVRSLAVARERGAIFNAVWMGAGEMEAALKAEIVKHGLADCTRVVPFENDRRKFYHYIEEADLLLVTHLSLESSRVQKESLNLGTPIVGYYTAYAEELVSEFGGGVFSRMGDSNALGKLIATLSNDRESLADLVGRAAKDGCRFTAKRVFAERALNIRASIDAAWKR